MYPFNILKFTISMGTISLFQFLVCIAKACCEYHSPSVELEMITSIPIPDL